MAAAMLIVAVLGVLYPRGQVSAKFDAVEDAEPTDSAPADATV
jgi:hypothetical protein